MSISAAWLLVPLLSEMSDVIRTVSDEAETSCCCCHQAWPISTSTGAVRYTKDHDQRVHHDQRPSHIYVHHKSAPKPPTDPCGSWCSRDHFWSSGSIHTQSLKHPSLNPPRTQSAFLRVEMTRASQLMFYAGHHLNGANDGHLLCNTQMRNLNSAHFHKPSQSFGLWVS